MSKIMYATKTIRAAKAAQKGNLQKAAVLMAESSGAKKRIHKELSHHFMNWFEKNKEEVFDEAFLESMFEQHLGLILHLLKNK